MGNIIRLPVKNNSQPSSSPTCSSEQSPLKNKINYPPHQKSTEKFVISPDEDPAFMELIREWPCFRNVADYLTLNQLFQKYREGALNLAQDSTFEFMLHMHDPDSPFDIGHALYNWDEEDQDFFIMSLNMHAQLILKAKKDQL